MPAEFDPNKVQVLWTLPVPASALLDNIAFQIEKGKICHLSYSFESGEINIISERLIFKGVEAYKVTHTYACPTEKKNIAFDKVVDLGKTHWLTEIQKSLLAYKRALPILKHLLMFADDMPCYEFICEEFYVEKCS